MSAILDSCFFAANSIEKVERIDAIPEIEKNFIECWKISTEIFVDDILTPIVLYAGFKSEFPYSLPSFYFQSTQFGYLPHIESQGGKLCLFEDGVSFKIDNPEDLVIYCINKAKKLVREGAEKKNFEDFNAEITSYWTRTYNRELVVDECYIIYDKIPSSTTVLNTIKYAVPIAGLKKKDEIYITLLYGSDDEPFDSFISRNYLVSRGKALFVCGFQIPSEAPYDMFFYEFLNRISPVEDRKQVINFINHNRGGNIFFQLTSIKIGGVFIPPVSLNKKGFRKGILKTSDIYLKFEKKNSKLLRLYGSLYSKNRIADRTLGTLMPKHRFAVAGIGSIGSNLVHFLNGHNNVSFTLIDGESLSIDNIGRHLLGFQFVNQFKAYAVAEHLHSIRPEQDLTAKIETIQDFINTEIDNLNKHTALFACTGDTMTDEFIINAINQEVIKIPVFFLWLEPYGSAGHLIYLNGTKGEPLITIVNPDTMLYKYNLIEDSEYKKQGNQFSKNDAGCNGSYTLYSGNDVIEMLCAFYPIICKLLKSSETSKCYRWIGNVEEIEKRGIKCKEEIENLPKGTIQQLSI